MTLSPGDVQATAPVPCLVCTKPLVPAFEDCRQPLGAITFRGAGSWGSEFDEMRGELQIHVCDGCLRERSGSVLHVHTVRTETEDVRPWKPEEADCV